MYQYRSIVHFCVFIIIVAFAFNNSYNPFILNDAEKFSYTVSKSEDSLYQKIRTKSTDYRKPPENAIIDKVWKKIPGLNGVRVDVDKSFEQMKKSGVFDKTLLVYEQVPPEITYDELPAAPTYRGHPEKDMVSFLINVAWGNEYIPAILNVLKEHNVKANFFVEGKWAQENADFVKMIDEQGHVIGNHAYNHPDMSRLSKQQITEQINRTNEIIKAITDNKPKWLAPPSGNYNDQVVKIAHEMNMETILWSVDTIDWKNPSVSVMMNRVNNNIHPGATVLMHPTSSTAQGLESLIVSIKEKGYKIGTISSLLSEER